MSSGSLLLPLSSPEATLARAGGKGANLARLIAGGFPVPDGFVLTVDAYRAFVAANGGAALTALPADLDPEDPDALERAAADLHARFVQGRVPAEVSTALRAAYEDFSGGAARPVAVRSSATAEDLAELSFAGQQETYLNVVGAEALLAAVVRCWASLWTARAIAYRARAGVPTEGLALAVVVQALVPSEVSGVLFTANPLTGHRGELVIDASFGLGEALVAGQVEPDHFVFDAASGRVTTRRLGAKAFALVPREGGGTEPRPASGARASLSDDEVSELARLALRVAGYFGAPQDIEWARADGRWHLLQSRPITSLYPLPEGGTPDGPLRAFINFNALQGFPDPFTPLGADPWCARQRGLLSPGSTRDVETFALAGGRLFRDVTALIRDPRLGRQFIRLASNAEPAAARALMRLLQEKRFGAPVPLGLRTLWRVARAVAPRAARAVATLVAPERMRDRATAEVNGYAERAHVNARSAPTLSALLDAYEQDLPWLFARTLVRTTPVFIVGIVLMRVLDRWLESALGFERGTGLRLSRGVPGNVTTEMDLELWALAQAVRGDAETAEALRARDPLELAEAYRRGALPAVLQRGLGEFLAKYGMRSVGEIDMARPRWADDPSPVLQTVASYLELEDPALAPDAVFAAGARDAERLADECVARAARGPLGFLRAKLVRAAIRRVRALVGLRELHKFGIVRVLGAYRTALLDHARDLVARGALARAEDIFFVPRALLRRAANGERVDLLAEVQAQRTAYTRELARRRIPRVLLSTGEAFFEGITDAGVGDLRGEGVSPGSVEGIVNVVLDPRGARLSPGEILVCPATDPGWTPLFLAAGGLVMEMGGMMTHGSVVAREYGLPAVVGVHQATTRLRTGQRIRVDGTTGAIVLLDGPDTPVRQEADPGALAEASAG